VIVMEKGMCATTAPLSAIHSKRMRTKIPLVMSVTLIQGVVAVAV